MNASALLLATDAWRSAFPSAVVGALVMRGVRNPEQSAALEAGRRRLIAAYAPAGVGGAAVRAHLEDIRTNVQLVTPEAQTQALMTVTAS